MSRSDRRETMSLAQRVLLEELERAFNGDGGARTFVQAALRAAGTTVLPKEPEPLLDFVRAHMLVMVTGELGGRGASEFLARVTAAMGGLPLFTLYDSGVQVKRDRDTDGTTLHPVDVPIALHSTTMRSVAPRVEGGWGPTPPSSGRGSARLRAARLPVVLAYDDRFGRVGLARQLLQAHCDVLLVDTFSALAAIDEAFPTVAIVHLGLEHVEHLLLAMLTRNPELRVVAIPVNDDRDGGERMLGAAKVQYFQLVPTGSRPADVVAIALDLACR